MHPLPRVVITVRVRPEGREGWYVLDASAWLVVCALFQHHLNDEDSELLPGLTCSAVGSPQDNLSQLCRVQTALCPAGFQWPARTCQATRLGNGFRNRLRNGFRNSLRNGSFTRGTRFGTPSRQTCSLYCDRMCISDCLSHEALA